jgi:hypothetical protein
MQSGPFNHVTEHARRQFAIEDGRIPYGNLRGELVVYCVEVGQQMLSRYLGIEMPRKRLISGMDGLWFLSQQHFRHLAGHLQPERIGTEIKLVIPEQFPAIADARFAKIVVAVPKRKNTRARLLGKIHLSFHAVVEAQPNAITVQDLQ